MIHVRTLSSAATFLLATGLCAQLAVTTNQNPEQLLTDVLLGDGVTVTNITFNGVPSPAAPQPGTGAFVSNGSNLGLDAGIILSSGLAQNIAAPASSFQSDLLSPNLSDPDLVAIAGVTINNAAVLEFDFIPLGDTIRFRYVFGSEEYPEFVCSFNDAFGFFLSGPGIAGPYSNGAVNIALIPGTNTPVTIDNVNNGLNNNPNNPGCPATNPEYYINNGTGGSVVYDGMTVVLEAVYPVECGQLHHIKLAIGDALDQAYDSGVFLEAGSFSSTPFVPSLSPGPGIIGSNTIMESCYPVQIDFTRIGDLTVSSSVTIEVGGTATPGVDYTPAFPNELVFDPGIETLPFVFNVPIDPDEDETIVLTLTSVSDCSGFDIVNVFTFNIINPPPLVATSFDANVQCGDSIDLLTEISGGYAPYTVDWGAAGTGNPITVTPLAFTNFVATVTDDCGTTTTADFGIGLIELPPINAAIIGSSTLTEGCESNQINIIRPQGVPGELVIDLFYSGSAENGSDYDMPATVTIGNDILNILVPFQPLQDGVIEGPETVTILVSFTDDCGRTVDASVTITIIDAPLIELETEDIRIECVPDSMMIDVVATGGYQGNLSYEWSNGSTEPFTYVSMTIPGTYAVTVSDACGQSEIAYVNVTIDCEVIVPNVFTPNSDGVNDFWSIEGIISQPNTVRVYNRWGSVVFEASNYQNTWSAVGVPDGTYFYEVLVPNRPESPLTGHLTILRNRW